MRLRIGDMFGPDVVRDIKESNVFLVTTNAFVKSDNKLVMGRGAARQLSILYPQAPLIFGTKLVELGLNWMVCKDPYPYGVITDHNSMYGIFQVKDAYWQQAGLNLIQHSTNCLIKIANSNPSTTYHLNYPGIGNGGLTESIVEPIIAALPDNVVVWKLKP